MVRYLIASFLLLSFLGCKNDNLKNEESFVVFNQSGERISGTRTNASSSIANVFPLPSLKKMPNIYPDTIALYNELTYRIQPTRIRLKGKPKTGEYENIGLPIPVELAPTLSALILPEILPAKDPLLKMENPVNFSFYTRSQGLAHDDISSIVFDQKGNMWIGTYGAGVVRFDGKHFSTYNTENGLIDNYILSLLVDSKGRLLIGTRHEGLIVFDGVNFYGYNMENGLPANRVESLFEDSKGNIWIGTFNGGIALWNDNTFTFYDTNHGLPGQTVYSIVEDDQNNLWFGIRGWGVSRFNGQSFTNYSTDNGMNDNYVTSLLFDQNNHLWIGTDQGGLSRFDGEFFYHYNVSNGFPDNDITVLFQNSQGEICIGTKKSGLIKYNGEFFTRFREPDGMVNSFITSIAEDKSGKLWFGTYGGGIGTSRGDIFRHHSEREGIPQGFVRAILPDDDGNVWFGTNTEGAFILKPDHVLHYNTSNGFPDDRVRALYNDNRGNIWFGFLSGGITTFDGERFHSFAAHNILSDISVSLFFQQKNGVFWIGTSGDGLFRIENQEITHFNSTNDLYIDHVRKIVEDRYGIIWIGTRDGGIFRYDGDSFRQFSKKEGLSINGILDMIIDKDENLWIGTDGAGVFLLRDGVFRNFTEKNGLGSNYVYSILEDKSGEIWFGTRWGLSMLIDREQFTFDVTSNLTSKAHQRGIYFKNFPRNEGFLGFGVNSRSMAQDDHGTVWIGANDILTAFKTRNFIPDTIPPHLYIKWVGLFNEAINWSGIVSSPDSIVTLSNGVVIDEYSIDSITPWYGIPKGLKLSHRNNYLVFSFAAVTSGLEDNVRYQYKLSGHDNKWSILSTQSEVHYGNLKPGGYSFEVIAMNSQGVFSNQLSFPFRILIPWWQTWWAFFIYILVSGIIVFVFNHYRRNLKKLKERRKQEELALHQQIEIARKSAEFKQNFLANMSHEIRTPLTGILGMADLLKKTRLDEVQEDYLKTLIHSGENLRETINLVLDYSKIEAGKVRLNEEIFSMAQLFDEAEKLFLSLCRKEIRFHKHLDSDVPEFLKGDYNRIFQILNNLMSNAVKFTSEGKVGISGFLDSKVNNKGECLIRIEVSDTGSGIGDLEKEGIFKPFYQAEQAYDRAFEGTGLGLAICKELSYILGGAIGFESKKGIGSEFWFTFKASPSGPKLTDDQYGVQNSLPEKPLNILLVEDKIVNQKVISLLLKSMNHIVTIANNGEEALVKFKPMVYDLVLMDIQMPVMDGITATQQLKMKYDHLPPIVGLSANAFEGDREKYMGKGMDEYITKPVKEADFKEIIAKLNL